MKAEFSSLSRDLYWSAFINGATCRWIGYDDAHWWNHVAPTDQFQVKIHQGKPYRLNPETNEITPL